MRNRGHTERGSAEPGRVAENEDETKGLPQPSASYRRRAWRDFQRALDPLAPIKPLPPPRS
jgi:hypothetical protein